MIHRQCGYLLAFVLTLPGSVVQADDGWQLLFVNAGALSETDQQTIYRHLGLRRSTDGKELLVMGGEAAGPARFEVSLQDINADGRSEVFVTGGNTFLSGSSGSSIWLFTQSASGSHWQMNLGFPAAAYTVLAVGNAGYPDLRFAGTGTCDAVWRWDGDAYEHYQDVATRPGGCAELP